MTDSDESLTSESDQSSFNLRMLTEDQIREIDRALVQIGKFGEVHLVKIDGELKVIRRLKSETVD